MPNWKTSGRSRTITRRVNNSVGQEHQILPSQTAERSRASITDMTQMLVHRHRQARFQTAPTGCMLSMWGVEKMLFKIAEREQLRNRNAELEARHSELEARIAYLKRIAELEARIVELENQRPQPNDYSSP